MSMSLEYTQDRRAELEENIKGVEADMPGKVGSLLVSEDCEAVHT